MPLLSALVPICVCINVCIECGFWERALTQTSVDVKVVTSSKLVNLAHFIATILPRWLFHRSWKFLFTIFCNSKSRVLYPFCPSSGCESEREVLAFKYSKSFLKIFCPLLPFVLISFSQQLSVTHLRFTRNHWNHFLKNGYQTVV